MYIRRVISATLCLTTFVFILSKQIPIHMFSGIWGSFATGLFAVPRYIKMSHPQASSAGAFYSNGKLLACQLMGILWVMGWVSFTMFPFFCILHYKGWLRADSLEEIVGLDVSYHGGMFAAGGETEGSSNHEEEERLYYERKEEKRKSDRNKLRRRVLMMDLSLSGHKDNATDEFPENTTAGNAQETKTEDPLNIGDASREFSAAPTATNPIVAVEEGRGGHDHSG